MPKSPEQLLLSSVLRNGDLKTAIAHGVTRDMFHTFQAEWAWIEDYYRKYSKAPSRATFIAKFDDFRISQVNDTAYLVEEVKKSHARQQLLDIMNDVAELVSAGDIDGAIRRSSSSIVEVAAGLGTAGDGDIFTEFSDILSDVESRVKRVQEQGAAGVPFGIPSLDELTGGANPGDLIIVGGRLGHGKSWVLQNMAARATSAGFSAVFNALEQSRSQVAFRIHSLLSSASKEFFASHSLMRGKDFDIAKYRKYLRDLKRTVSGRLHVSDASRGRVSPLTCAAQIERHQPDVMYIDYLTLMQKSGPDWQGVAQLSGDTKQLAVNYQIPVIAAAQLNREHGLSREPAGPEALAQSDSIGQDADMVLTLKQMSRSVIAMRMAKHRNGSGDHRFYLEFRPGDGVIQEVSYNKAMDLMDADRDAADAESVR